MHCIYTKAKKIYVQEPNTVANLNLILGFMSH